MVKPLACDSRAYESRPFRCQVAVGLALHHRFKWFIHLPAQGLSKGDEHPTNTPHGVGYSLPLVGIDAIVAAADMLCYGPNKWNNDDDEPVDELVHSTAARS